MKFNILSIGKFKNVSCETLFNEYKKRMNFDINLKELVLKKNYEGEKLKEEEGKLLLQNCGTNNSRIISLDERGKIISTIDFYNLIMNYQNSGVGEVDFIIGGAEGLSQEVRDKSNFILSFIMVMILIENTLLLNKNSATIFFCFLFYKFIKM